MDAPLESRKDQIGTPRPVVEHIFIGEFKQRPTSTFDRIPAETILAIRTAIGVVGKAVVLNRKPYMTTAPANDRKIDPRHELAIATNLVLQARLR